VEADGCIPSRAARRALRIAADSCAVVSGDHRRSYAELGSRCRRLAGALRGLGLGPGDRVGVIGLNSDRYLELYLGVPAAGFVLAPVNSRLAAAEMRAILQDAGVRVLFTDGGYAGAVAERVVTMPGEYEDLISAADEAPLGEGVAEDDLAVLFYTSGTTGAAKGAMHSHRGLVSSGLHFMATWPFDRDTRWLVSSPMFHTGGTIAMMATVWSGGRHVMMPSFEPDLALDLIEREGVTHAARADHARCRRQRPAFRLRPALGRYLGVEPRAIAFTHGVRGKPALAGAAAALQFNLSHSGAFALLALSRDKAVGVDVRVIDASGAEVPPAVVGEIIVRSPSVMTGYWQKPEETAAVLAGDWYRTGDLGYQMRSHTSTWSTGPRTIVSGGESIYSTEVESALSSHPSVDEVAVFGVPDERWGEAVHAVVVCRADVTADELMAHCRARIARFKVPKRIELRAEPLPKSAAGKVLKRDLRDPYWATRQTRVGGA
jgi:long-chain acyl-CoA synthetase